MLELWMRRTSSRPLRMFPQCRYGVLFIPDFYCLLYNVAIFSLHTVRFLFSILSPLLLHSSPALPQIYSNREVEEAMTKIRDVLSDDKRDWELRVAAVRPPDLSVVSV